MTHVRCYIEQARGLPHLTTTGRKRWIDKGYSAKCGEIIRRHKSSSSTKSSSSSSKKTFTTNDECIAEHFGLMMKEWLAEIKSKFGNFGDLFGSSLFLK